MSDSRISSVVSVNGLAVSQGDPAQNGVHSYGNTPAPNAPSLSVAQSLSQRTLTQWREFPSDFALAKQAQEALLRELEELEFREPALFAIKLAVEEAVTNAIRHGNRLDANRRVRLGWWASPEEVVVTVADEGPGFDPNAVPDPTLPEHLELPHGRGLMLMRAFMSEVAHNALGNQVWLRRLNDETQPR